MKVSTTILQRVRDELSERCGLRTTHISDELLGRASTDAALEAGHTTVAGYLESLQGRFSADALQFLLRRVTVGETQFFRHPDDTTWLRREALPSIVQRRQPDKQLRIWSAGCASGEEAYTLAALAFEAINGASDWDIHVLATDISRSVLQKATDAEYGSWSFRGVDKELKERWFERVDERKWKPRRWLRDRVVFDYLNLRDPIYPSVLTHTTNLDLILCRNVFIYFYPETIAAALERFSRCLVEGGRILCGPADLEPTLIPSTLRSLGGLHRLGLSSDPAPVPERPRLQTTEVRSVATNKRVTRPQRTDPAPPAVRTPSSLDLLASLQAGRYDEVIEAARIVTLADPLATEAQRCLAMALTGVGDAAATQAWKHLVYLAPTDPGAHLGLGFALLRAQHRPAARRHFQTVLNLLESVDGHETLSGPDALPVSWVQRVCRSLAAAEDDAARGSG